MHSLSAHMLHNELKPAHLLASMGILCMPGGGSSEFAGGQSFDIHMQATWLQVWWTPTLILFVTIVLLAAAFGYILFRWTKRMSRLAVLRERERLALEIHDTLAQSFAGLAFKLQEIRDEIPEGNPLRGQIETALKMVRRGHKDAKQTITTIRSAFGGSENCITDSLKEFGERLSDSGSLTMRASCHGHPRRIAQRVADTLVLIGQEAISNSIRHSGASEIEIVLDYQKDATELSVRDNGSGFVAHADRYGFGLQGMNRRATSISALLRISSSPGRGTLVAVRAPIARSLPFAHEIHQLFGSAQTQRNGTHG